MPQIICENVSLGYENRPILKDLSFTVNSGDYLCIVGENGSGKSTLMKTMLALTPPLAGCIRMEEGLTSTQIGYLPQQTQVQRDFPASVREVVLSGFQGRCGLRPFYTKAEKKAAQENMERMAISQFARKCYRELSGGQQQRVLLARALCAAKSLLILDEPITGLDPAAAQDLYKTLAYLNEKEGMAIVMVTHDLKAALRSARTVLHIGRDSWFSGTTAEYLASPWGKRFGGDGV